MKNQEKYNREFKINTVKLCRESSKSMSEIARDLGVAKSTLYMWTQEYKEHGEDSFPGSGLLKPCNARTISFKEATS